MISNDTFYGLVFERDRVQTLLQQCSAYELSGILEYVINRRFPGWNKADECFRSLRGESPKSELIFSFFQKGRITFADLLAAYNQVNYSSINPKFQSYYVPGGTVVQDDTPAITDDFEMVQKPPPKKSEETKMIKLLFVDANGAKCKGVTITSDAGATYTCDSNGEISIDCNKAKIEELSVVSIELS